MRVFITGATGFIGSALVKDLLAAGHQVRGLSRSDAGAKALSTAGAQVERGSVEDLNVLKAGVAQADGVVHLAFNHDFSKFKENCESDRRIVEALGSYLAGSDRPLVVTSGTALTNSSPGALATEEMPPVSSERVPRAATEEAAAACAAQGVNVSVMRLAQIHDPVKQGLIPYATAAWRAKGVCFYVGEGQARWPAAHVLDTARLYRLALEKAERGAHYHAVAEEGVSMRDIADTIARRLKLPTKSIAAQDAESYFGWLAMFAGHDMPASSEQTRRKLNWKPTGPTLLEDLARLEIAD